MAVTKNPQQILKYKVTNNEALSKLGKKTVILKTIKYRKLDNLCHILLTEGRCHLLQLILQGKIRKKRGVCKKVFRG